jgi:hypothetical protein
MAIEIDVADQIGMSAVAGFLQATVIDRFDGPYTRSKTSSVIPTKSAASYPHNFQTPVHTSLNES